MSTYKKLTKELLDACKEMLIEATEQDLTKISIRYVIILLYEYCTCYAYLQMHTAFIDGSVNIALKSLQQYCCKLLNNDIANHVCYQFYSTRNSFAHITESLFDDSTIIELLNTDGFYTILSLLNVPEALLAALRNYNIKSSQEEFNPWEYIRQEVGDYIKLLPVAALDNCKTPEDCHDLVDSLAHLL